jgi:hypothetical protein
MMTAEEKLQGILGRVSALNDEADKIQDPIERRRFLAEGIQRIHADLEPILGRHLTETQHQPARPIAADANAIGMLLLLAKQGHEVASHVLQALIDEVAKPEE